MCRYSAQIEPAGAGLFSADCAVCHGQNAVGIDKKDLRHLTPQLHAQFNDIVLEGKLKALGMAPFKDILTTEQVAQIHAYVIARAQEDWQPDFMHPRQQR
jgi:quinohemoprotein ethanol dehydrogenase